MGMRMGRTKDRRSAKALKMLNRSAAGIDVGAGSNFVAVDPSANEQAVREFSSFTDDLHNLASWLRECRVTTVAMEATGIYWIPLFEVLESKGFEVVLVNARHVKNVPGRKSDVLDCQWLQQLHSYGLLQASFRPTLDVCALRAYVRQRGTLVRYAGSHIQHMQKALHQMNLKLDRVVSNICGKTGMTIIRSILAGERDAKVLAGYRDGRCKRSEEDIARSLCGTYREEYLLQLRQAVESYDFYQMKISECEREILKQLNSMEPDDQDLAKPTGKDEVSQAMAKITGVDLTLIEGINATIALIILSEIGYDLSRWKSVKHFCSWLGLCPGTKISGGKVLGKSSRRTANRAAGALRMAAMSLHNSKSALGGFLRRMKSRLGAPKAITATAHKLARLLYSLLKNGNEYLIDGLKQYEDRYQAQKLQGLVKHAKSMGFQIIPLSQ